MKKLFLLGALSGALFSVKAQDFYDRSTVQTIEIYFAASNWDALLDNLASTTEDYLLADSVRINGVVYDSVGVKYKGNSSYNANYNKNPFHIKLDYIHGSYDYQGYTDVKLQNGYQDPSMIREVLSYAVLEQYMDCPKANFANVYVNGSLRGLYSNAQSIDERFNGDHYYSADGSFFKCNPIGGAGPGGGGNPDLNYLGTDTSLYSTRYELLSNYGWTDLVNMINVLNNDFTNIENILDMDRAIWMLAYNNVLVNLDSYSGAFRQNYYLYNDLNDRWVPTVWDLNMSFGGFPGGTGSGPLTTPSQLDPMSNSTSTNHPLIVKVMANPMYKRMYMAHLRTIVQEIFSSGDYVTTAQTLQSTIDASVQADPYKFFTYAQFQGGLTSNTTVSGGMGSTTIYGIQNLMDARVTYFNANSNYLLVAPTIPSINASNTSPAYGETITMTATCTNETTVYLGYRFNHIFRFNRVQMFDDGAHNDGAAGDHVYGADVTMNGAYMEYYVYAENSNAGLFSPQRAEHEFYTLLVAVPVAQSGDVLINELMADNNITAFDEYGESNDWFELFNTTNSVIDVSGLYVSDDITNLVKYQIPAGTIIPANGVIEFWADQDTIQYGLHTNFKLGASGESLYLSDGTNYYDVVDYPAQTTDVSYARCPDGQTFTFAVPTFNALNNCFLSVDESLIPLNVALYPVPTGGNVNVRNNEGKEMTITVVDLQGRKIYSAVSMDEIYEIPSANWQAGYYRVNISMNDGRTLNLPMIKE